VLPACQMASWRSWCTGALHDRWAHSVSAGCQVCAFALPLNTPHGGPGRQQGVLRGIREGWVKRTGPHSSGDTIYGATTDHACMLLSTVVYGHMLVFINKE
jgi:hypothetical protein